MAVEELGVEFVIEGLGTFIGSMKKADDATAAVGTTAGTTSNILDTALAVALGTGIVKAAEMAYNALIKVGGAIVGMAQDSIAVESAFAGVLKTTDGLIDPMGNLTQAGVEMKQGFRDLAKEVPITLEELMGIGEVGGQLGITEDNLLGFTETIAALGVTTNLSSQEAAMGLSQFSNIMGTSQGDISNLGSAIVYLGNNFATTEADVMNFGQRIAGAGAVVGMTEGDVLGISAAFSSMGINAEAGGTAVQKTLLDMNTAVVTGGDQLKLYAQTAGVSADEFSAMWETDAAGAFSMFVTGLGEQGDNATATLQELGLEDQRLVASFLSMSQNGELLTSAINGANTAFAENTALAAEAETRYSTTESQMQILQNNVRDLGLSFGDALLPAVNSLIEGLLPLIDQYGPMLSEVFLALGDSLLGIVDGFLALFGVNPAGGIAEIGEVIGAVFGEGAQDAFLGFVGWLQTSIPEALTFAQGVIQQFSDFFATISPIIDGIVTQIKTFWQSLQDNAAVIWTGIQNIISGFVDIVLGIITTWLAVITGEWSAAWVGIQQILQGAWDFIAGIVTTAFGLILSICGTNLTALSTTIAQIWVIIKTVTSSTWASILSFLSSLWASIKTIATAVWEGIKTTVSNVVEGIKTAVNTAFESIKSTATSIWEGIKSTISTAVEGAKSAVTTAFDGIISFLTGIDLTSIGSDIVQGLINGISASIGGITDALMGGVDAAINAAKKALGIQSPSKLMEQEIGEPMGAGVAVGVTKTTPIIQSSLANAITPNISGLSVTRAGSSVVNNAQNYSRTSNTTNNIRLTPDMLLEPVGMPRGQSI